MQPIRVFVADDHALLRSAVRALLRDEGDIAVAGEAASGDEALRGALTLQPDVVLMDLGMPGCSAFEATQTITQSSTSRVLVLTMRPEAEGLLPALRAGATGYLSKSAPPDELARAIRVVARGDVLLSPSGLRALVRAVAAGAAVSRRGRAEGRRDAVPTGG